MITTAVLVFLIGLPLGEPPSPPAAPEVPSPVGRSASHWAVSLSDGRSFYDSRPMDGPKGSLWQDSHRQSEIRVIHLGTPWVIGAALHRMSYPSDPDAYAIGAGLVMGARHGLLPWLFEELDATLGLQVPRRPGGIMMPSRSPGADSPAAYVGEFSAEESGSLELFARLNLGLALQVAQWLDLPLRLTLHMCPHGEYRALGAFSLGVRFRLP